ncbi:hypothetical protein SLEP1_g2245 [Rubroshorea leprosula]|uniref:Uncharacterized protein n=1 Tax=Rubroshorea leprosula TaxID=152421 RepID=A0AAV5HH06_9ROSI|nr:hypothetical protein SLEP1_g2245 [Rubroshorea leprosula]
MLEERTVDWTKLYWEPKLLSWGSFLPEKGAAVQVDDGEEYLKKGRKSFDNDIEDMGVCHLKALGSNSLSDAANGEIALYGIPSHSQMKLGEHNLKKSHVFGQELHL